MLLLLLACTTKDDSGQVVTAPFEDVPVDDTVPVVLSSTECSACGGDCRIDELSYAQRYHADNPITYADRPPAGGPHNPCWTSWGVHDTKVEDENWVHNLEHGGVAFLYACTDCQADVDGIIALTTGLGEYTVVTPYDEMESPFAVTAWGWRLVTGCFDPAVAEAFYRDHVNQGPESTMADPAEGCM